MNFREIVVGANNYSGDFEWITEGGDELTVVADAIGQALKWQSIFVLEKGKFFFVKMGGNTDIFVP